MTKFASSEARNATWLATSSGLAIRPNGVASEGSALHDNVDMPIEGYVSVIEMTDLKGWLDDALKGLPIPGPDTTLGALKEQSEALSQSILEMREIKQRLQKLSSLVARGKGRDISMNHNKHVTAHLDAAERGASHLRRILESGQVERFKAILDDHVSRLEQSAKRLDTATEELKRGIISI